MADLTSELAERARVLAAEISLGFNLDPDAAIAFGVDLLLEGWEGPAVVGLAALSPGLRWVDVEQLARDALDEVGVAVEDSGASEAVRGWWIARQLARELQKGGDDTYMRAAELWGLWWTLGTPSEIGALVPLMDAWEELLGDQRLPVEAQLAALAGPIIDAADRAITGAAG